MNLNNKAVTWGSLGGLALGAAGGYFYNKKQPILYAMGGGLLGAFTGGLVTGLVVDATAPSGTGVARPRTFFGLGAPERAIEQGQPVQLAPNDPAMLSR